MRLGAILLMTPVLASSTWLLVGCAGDEGAPSVAEHWEVQAIPLFEIGDGDTPSDQLFRVADAFRLPDGGVVIANAGTHEIRWYDAEGRYLDASGREGDGPADFRLIHSLRPWSGDSIAVFDPTLGRFSYFDATGELGRTQPLVPAAGRIRVEEARLVDDGAVFTFETSASAPPALEQLDRRSLRLYYRAASDVEPMEIDTVPGSIWSSTEIDGRLGFARVLFSPTPKYDQFGRCVVVAAGDRLEVEVHSPSGALRTIGVDVASDVITDELVNELVNELFEALGSVPPEARASLLQFSRPDSLPLTNQMLVDRLGLVWLQRFSPPTGMGRQWIVVGAGGDVVAEVEMPEDLIAHDIGEDFVLATRVGALDEELVGVYRLIRTGRATGASLEGFCAD